MYILIKNKKEFDNLMTIYQDKGWLWYSGANPKDVTLFHRHQNDEIAIEYRNGFTYTRLIKNTEHISFKKFLIKLKIKKLI